MMLKPREFCNSYCKFYEGSVGLFILKTSYVTRPIVDGRVQCATTLLLQYTR